RKLQVSFYWSQIGTRFFRYLTVSDRGMPKHAVNGIKRKVGVENPHVSLYALQVWSHAFRNEPKYKIVQDTFNILKLEGQSFPQLKESDAMFSAEKAPEWKDADCCSRCRTTFGMVQRKHHCRACGDVVCQKCSSKNSIIPKYGIEKEVRVCDSCYDKINTPRPVLRERMRSNYGIYGGGNKETNRGPSPIPQQQPAVNGETEEDPAQFLHALNSSVEIFVNRMRSNSTRGRSIAVDSSVQSLFNVISNMHPQLMKYVQQQEDLRDALREDHREKKRREFEEMERLRQIQMAQKLDIMRQKKHEYLEMQRQLALQRMQEQEREMQMRFEQQRQLTQMRQMQNYGGFNQAGYPQGQMQGMPPQGMYGPGPGAPVEGSPVHQMQQGAQMAPGQGYMPQMYPPHGGQQPQYNQSGAGPQSSMYQSIPPQGTHQYQGGYSQTDGPAPGGMHGQGGGAYQHHHGVQYNAADPSGAQSLPQGAGGGMPGGQGPGAYTSMPPQMGDYQQQGAFNLQGMSNALPENQGYGAQPPPQQQQHHPHQQPPQQQQQQYYIGGQGGAPPPPAQQYPPQGIGQPQGVEPGTSQHKPGPHEAELISFD
ncbi:HGS-like protein, partial [Mya arenaria]